MKLSEIVNLHTQAFHDVNLDHPTGAVLLMVEAPLLEVVQATYPDALTYAGDHLAEQQEVRQLREVAKQKGEWNISILPVRLYGHRMENEVDIVLFISQDDNGISAELKKLRGGTGELKNVLTAVDDL